MCTLCLFHQSFYLNQSPVFTLILLTPCGSSLCLNPQFRPCLLKSFKIFLNLSTSSSHCIWSMTVTSYTSAFDNYSKLCFTSYWLLYAAHLAFLSPKPVFSSDDFVTFIHKLNSEVISKDTSTLALATYELRVRINRIEWSKVQWEECQLSTTHTDVQWQLSLCFAELWIAYGLPYGLDHTCIV